MDGRRVPSPPVLSDVVDGPRFSQKTREMGQPLPYTQAVLIDQTIWNKKQGDEMKYVISWNERPQGSPAEYENAQKRILEVFGQWKAPANFKIEFFVVRVGDWGGHLLVDCDDPLAVHKFCSMLPAFQMEARP